MDVEFETRWRKLLTVLEERFGGGMDLQDILFLVGVQELGQGFRTFKKDEKMDLMHVAVCTVMVPEGFYRICGPRRRRLAALRRKSALTRTGAQATGRSDPKGLIGVFRRKSRGPYRPAKRLRATSSSMRTFLP